MSSAFVLSTSLARAQPTLDESPEAYEIVTATAVAVFPPPLDAFFDAHRDEIRAVAVETASATAPAATGPDRHYVMLDIAAALGDPQARRAAARKFPHDRTTAEKLFRRHGRLEGGTLPWTIQEHYDLLVRAFREGRIEAITGEAGAILHFATDAGLPFNTTADRDGAASGCLQWSAAGHSQASLQHRTVRHRIQVKLIGRLSGRLAYETRVAPERYRLLASPLDGVFEVLLKSHQALATLCSLDVEAIAEGAVVDAESFVGKLDDYYMRIEGRAAPILESRLEDAALLGANLIGSAWVEAGQPPLGELGFAAPTIPVVQPSSAEGFVGSRHSTIFHRTTCTHARRIKPSNAVRFKTAREAQEAGRKPCKSCRPADP